MCSVIGVFDVVGGRRVPPHRKQFCRCLIRSCWRRWRRFCPFILLLCWCFCCHCHLFRFYRCQAPAVASPFHWGVALLRKLSSFRDNGMCCGVLVLLLFKRRMVVTCAAALMMKIIAAVMVLALIFIVGGGVWLPTGSDFLAPLTVSLGYLVEVPPFYFYCLWP